MEDGHKVKNFRGRHFLSMDPKGRVSVPSQFREALANRNGGARLMLATPFDRCLRGYMLEEWEKIEEKAAQLPQTDPNVKKYNRHFISSAVEVECDGQGRILIPPTHREWAGITGGQVVFLGLTAKMEIWDRARFNAEMEVEDSVSVEEAITGLGGLI